MIHRIPSGQVNDLWPLVYEHAKLACEHTPFIDADDLYLILINGHAQLFIVTKDGAFMGFVAMELIQYPRCAVANTLAAGGERGFLRILTSDVFPELERWGKEHGAHYFAVHGRPGWLRIAKSFAGSEQMTIGIAWRRLGYERRQRQSNQNDTGSRTVEGRTAVPDLGV